MLLLKLKDKVFKSSIPSPLLLLMWPLPRFGSRPPLTYLFAVQFLWILPLNEFTLRLPYALFGIFQLPLVFKTSEMLFGRRVAVVAMAIFACSGMFAINRLSFGISVYVFMEM